MQQSDGERKLLCLLIATVRCYKLVSLPNEAVSLPARSLLHLVSAVLEAFATAATAHLHCRRQGQGVLLPLVGWRLSWAVEFWVCARRAERCDAVCCRSLSGCETGAPRRLSAAFGLGAALAGSLKGFGGSGRNLGPGDLDS